MPSTPSTRIRAELQAAGENLNTWGAPKLNAAIQRLEEAICGRYGFTLSGTATLTSTNYSADQARMAFLDCTGGTGGTITTPGVEKVYYVRNAATGSLVFTTGAGTSATVVSGDSAVIVCDGTNWRKLQANDFATSRLTNVGYPSNPTDAATKQYADDLAFTANSGVLPAQTGNANKFLTTNGTTASWGYAGLFWNVINSNITLAVTNGYAVDTTAARSLALPSATGLAGSQSIRVADIKGLAATNNITVTANGSDPINGVASDPFVVDVNWGDVVFVPTGTGWDTVVA